MVFGDGQSNGVIQFYPVAMATKFGTKGVCTRHMYETYVRDTSEILASNKGF